MVSKTSPQQSVSKYQPRKKEAWLYEIPKQEAMQTNVHIYADEAMLAKLQEDGSLQQGINVACLPGLVGNVCMMPDAHQGYGFPIGGVAAFDAHNGIVTPGGIGFDINCGVRLLATTLTKEQVLANIHQLLDELFVRIPSGVGKESTIKLSKDALDAVLQYGAHWAVEQGYGTKEDAVLAEEGGMLRAADPKAVSQKAKARGIAQLGTLGAGNHFLEIQYVDAVYDPTTAARMRITGKGQVVVMIHCGSRGLGHQVCSDYLKKMEDVFPQLQKKLPEKDLVYAPLSSKQAQEYLCAMRAAANFAWANRHIIAHQARLAFKAVFGNQVQVLPVYDVAHNIAKSEVHEVNGKAVEVLVHRKGATRAFGPSNSHLPEQYQATGQPVIIPGSMGTASYLLCGTNTAMQKTFGSSAHGAGRMLSRVKATKLYQGEAIKKELAKHEITIKAASSKGIAEEAPLAYKDIDAVIKITQQAGISTPIARFRPIGVIKG